MVNEYYKKRRRGKEIGFMGKRVCTWKGENEKRAFRDSRAKGERWA